MNNQITKIITLTLSFFLLSTSEKIFAEQLQHESSGLTILENISHVKKKLKIKCNQTNKVSEIDLANVQAFARIWSTTIAELPAREIYTQKTICIADLKIKIENHLIDKTELVFFGDQLHKFTLNFATKKPNENSDEINNFFELISEAISRKYKLPKKIIETKIPKERSYHHYEWNHKMGKIRLYPYTLKPEDPSNRNIFFYNHQGSIEYQSHSFEDLKITHKSSFFNDEKEKDKKLNIEKEFNNQKKITEIQNKI